jgi:hypothetical protein
VRGYQYYIHTYPWLVGNEEADRDRAAVSVWAGDIITFIAASSNGGEERELLLLSDVASPTLSPFKLDAITCRANLLGLEQQEDDLPSSSADLTRWIYKSIW